MDNEWSEKNKKMQSLIAKEATFTEGIKVLLELRAEFFEQITSIVKTFPAVAFYQMPFGVGEGNQHTTLAWSLWHLFRIEDIVAHTLILKDEQILFKDGWLDKTKSPIITTANELDGDAMIEFSKVLNIQATYEYCKTVMESTNEMLGQLKFADLKKSFSYEDKERLLASKCVNPEESSLWLIDYWCGKNIKGLIQMPFSRHWIMHVEAMNRIKNKLCQQAKKRRRSDCILRPYKPEDSQIICSWVKDEKTLFQWSADRIGKFPLTGNELNENYADRKIGVDFFPLTAVDEEENVIGHLFVLIPDMNVKTSVRFGFVIVTPEIRGKGFGKKMLDLAIEYAKKELKATRATLGVFANNPKAQACYETVGFRPYNKRIVKILEADWECIDMEMELK